MNTKISRFVVTIFVTLFVIVSLISTFHSIEFFTLTNANWMSYFLAAAFEIGQLATIAAIVAGKRLDMKMVWSIFIILTLFQIMGNVYYGYDHMNLDKYKVWSELFGTVNLSDVAQKRIIAVISGAFLPIISIGFSKSLVDYLKDETPAEIQQKKLEVLANQNEVETVIEVPEVETPQIDEAELQQKLYDAYLSAKSEIDSTNIPMLQIEYKKLNVKN
jgi:hypothetical protein